jgi:holo-[acyl-carrier protein] synthase
MSHGAVLAHEREIVEIAALADELRREGEGRFSAEERRYAASKSDPVRRLAARWAAKLAAARALGGGVQPEDVEVVRGYGAPRLRLGPRAEERRRVLGAPEVHVSLTHGLTHAAASVVLETPDGE